MNAVNQTFAKMRNKFGALAPDAELYLKAELVVEIEALKKQRNAVILGHNYMEPTLFHTVCDYRGDSLELSKVAARSTADVIVFCGVVFMAETAKVLNPSRTVLIPSLHAGCSLAESITGADVRKLRALFPGIPVVTYINTNADVKAETDICCTSGNAAAVVAALAAETVLFLPDEFLARNVAAETGRRFLTVEQAQGTTDLRNTLIGWNGRCMVHERFNVDDITSVRKQFPNVKVLSHPECPPEVCTASDFSGSTNAMVTYVQDTTMDHYLLLTECSMADNIIAENPGKDVLRMCSIRCPHMAQITLEMTRDALHLMRYEIDVPEEIRNRARGSLERMMAISASGPPRRGL